MAYYCNPVNVNYRYQFNQDPRTGVLSVNREAADPSMIFYQGRYYIFASMTLGVWVSDDLASWENHRLPDTLPLYDYAPDVRVIGGWVVVCASRRESVCDYYRTKDILNGPYERIEGSFPFWDPNLFQDDDGRTYFYWGCSNETPIYGVEVDPDTFAPIGERRELIFSDAFAKGYERTGENHSLTPRTEEEIDALVQQFAEEQGIALCALPPEVLPMIRGMFSQKPYIEGAWMDKQEGRYYLQYAAPGTEYNTYGDGVYVSDSPLGPFTLAQNNPYSYKPGGFITGAGHGSTMRDAQDRWWHASTMRVSVHHPFERRVGLWRAGFDRDGELYCNQRYGDWPMRTDAADPWAKPEWMLLSYRRTVTASSAAEGHEPALAADENIRTWWQAASADSDEWLCLDLGETMDVRAVQINFADDRIDILVPGELHTSDTPRYIDDAQMVTRWLLEGSKDGRTFSVIEDKRSAQTDLSHDLVVLPEGKRLRYLRISHMEVPYGQRPCLSGLRVFGHGNGEAPQPVSFTAKRTGDLEFEVEMHADHAAGYNVLWGSSREKLYHSAMCFDSKQKIGALVKGRNYTVRVDAFNENGITEGTVYQNI